MFLFHQMCVHCFYVLVVFVQTKTTARDPGFWLGHVGSVFVFEMVWFLVMEVCFEVSKNYIFGAKFQRSIFEPPLQITYTVVIFGTTSTGRLDVKVQKLRSVFPQLNKTKKLEPSAFHTHGLLLVTVYLLL